MRMPTPRRATRITIPLTRMRDIAATSGATMRGVHFKNKKNRRRHDTLRHDTTRHYMTWHAWLGMVRHHMVYIVGTTPHDTIRHDTIRHHMTRHDTTLHGRA